MPAARWLGEGESHAKMLRTAQALYGLDAVTIGGGGFLGAEACRSAAAPSLGAVAARAAAQSRNRLATLPDPESVAGGFTVALARDVIRRLRPVLGERAGIVVVLPSPSLLAAELGRGDDEEWAAAVVAAVLRTIGPEEPDAVLLLGDDDSIDPTLETLGEFYGAPVLATGRASPAGLLALSMADLLGTASPAAAWIYTSAEEIPADADPQALRAAINRLRARG